MPVDRGHLWADMRVDVVAVRASIAETLTGRMPVQLAVVMPSDRW